MTIKQAIEIIKCVDICCNAAETARDMAIEALQEKADRESHMQWLDDIKNPLEPIKVQAALKSEIMKYEYRKEHKPKDISTLDYTIMHALYKALAEGLREEKQ